MLSVQEVGNKKVAKKSGGTINTGYIPYWGSLYNTDKKKVISERKKQGVKLGGCKLSKNGKELDNLKEFKNYMFKSKITSLNNNVKNGNDEGNANDEPEDAGDQFGRK